MAGIPRASSGLVAVMLLALAIVLPAVQAQAPAPAPTSDGDLTFPCLGSFSLILLIDISECVLDWAGTSIDQGIAYLLMLVALLLTYLIHPLDASSPYKLF
ncbi:hypothetical protein BHM03_00013991 [Ensete ventricosum]|uniref:Uncharacterized protein n=1 Tax=Ensete ventricosum TaxID=4639 RepID=A0A426ZMY8_ENSVE|nr:hypothetical protein B296_00014494 [Ensete ventricosum]RZR86739.1 hypothetical protein BHM03_00013991 [Ensete ventricosum]